MSDVTIRLGSAEELFVAPHGEELMRPDPRLSSGMDELLSELSARRLGTVGTVTIMLPASEIHAGFEERVRDQIGKYCELRARETDNELRAMRHEGVRAAFVGILLLIVGLGLSALVLGSSAPHTIRTFFGEGVFVVIAWVGAWYPLDLLIHYTRPYSRSKKLLEAARRLDVVVEPVRER